MDDLLQEFLTGTNESLDVVDNKLVRFEQDPNNTKILGWSIPSRAPAASSACPGWKH